MNLPKSGASYTYSSGEDSFKEDRSFESSEHNYVNYRQKKIRAFNPDLYKSEKWLYDTPGVILPEQVKRIYFYFFDSILINEFIFFLKMLNKCSNRAELSYFDHQSTVIRPINIVLNIGQTILIGGIARIDIKNVNLCLLII